MALRTYLTGIADAIREKKGTTDPINAQDFASEISSISTGGGGTGDNLLQTLVTGKGEYGGYQLCYSFLGDNVDFITNIDFSAATNMGNMFQSCPNLTTIPPIPTSHVTKMSNMFASSKGLTIIPQINTNSATDMSYMYSYCNSLPKIDVTRLADRNQYFARQCTSLTKLIIRTMDTIPTFGTNMLADCYHLTGTVNSTYNPNGLQDGRIYVPDDKVDALKAATG